ncbi:hypothetical protein ACS4QD_14600 [Bacillus amyloliquefaciens]
MRWISFILVLAQLSGMSLSGYVVSEWGWHAAFWIGSGLGLCLSFMIREMKTTAMIIPHALALLVMETFFNRFSLGHYFSFAAWNVD